MNIKIKLKLKLRSISMPNASVAWSTYMRSRSSRGGWDQIGRERLGQRLAPLCFHGEVHCDCKPLRVERSVLGDIDEVPDVMERCGGEARPLEHWRDLTPTHLAIIRAHPLKDGVVLGLLLGAHCPRRTRAARSGWRFRFGQRTDAVARRRSGCCEGRPWVRQRLDSSLCSRGSLRCTCHPRRAHAVSHSTGRTIDIAAGIPT